MSKGIILKNLLFLTISSATDFVFEYSSCCEERGAGGIEAAVPPSIVCPQKTTLYVLV